MVKYIVSKTVKASFFVTAKIKNIFWAWYNYYSVGSVTKAYKTASKYIIGRFRQWMGRKHRWKTKGNKRYTDEVLYKESGLVNLMEHLPKYS
jgi:hypothetical protein